MYTLSDTRLEWLREESLFESNSNKRWGPIRGHYSSHLLVEVRPTALGQIWDPPGSISRRPEQVYLPSNPILEWPEEGPLFELNLNKCWAKM